MATFFGGGGGTAAAGKSTQGGFQGLVSSFQGLGTKDSGAKEAAQPPTAEVSAYTCLALAGLA